MIGEVDASGFGAKPLWPLSERYAQTLREGHHKQAPACGSPTLIWHMGLWPKEPFGDASQDASDAFTDRFAAYDRDHRLFFQEVSEFAVYLQRMGRMRDPVGLNLRPASLPSLPHQGGARTHAFNIIEPQGLAFTLWWNDAAGQGVANVRPKTPSATDLRVRVHVQTHADHATIAFFLDMAKMFGAAQVDDAEVMLAGDVGERRLKLQRAVQEIRRVSGAQIREGWVEAPRIPEEGVTPKAAQALLEAADYCYAGVWEEFAAAFNFAPTAQNGPHALHAERFADFRGLVMSVRGLDGTPAEKSRLAGQTAMRAQAATRRNDKVVAYADRAPAADAPAYATGTIGFGAPVAFDSEVNEAHTVAKSLWPFMRRMTPWADYSDWVCCTMADRKAIYLSALGSAALIEGDSEESGGREQEVPAGSLPEAEKQALEQRKQRSLRYLVLTKGEPPREQLGRFVDWINALGTMRLFALRDYTSIRNAGLHIEVLGRMLDGTLQDWESQRRAIDARRASALEAHDAAPAKRRGKRSDDDILKNDLHPRKRAIEELHIRELSDLIHRTEGRVIQIAGQLDMIGEGGSGRIAYAINRANFFSAEYMRLFQSMRFEDIPGWINYGNFVNRSVQPAFNVIASTGERLRAIRSRLESVTETIQTAALIVETAATRDNTATLNRIARSFWLLRLGVGGVALIALTALLEKILGWIEKPGAVLSIVSGMLGLR